MASLIEELIDTLEKEDSIYEELLPVVEKKAQIIIKNDLEELQHITAVEQNFIDQITGLEHNRNKIISNIAIVMNRKVETLNLKAIVAMLEKQPAEQERLGNLHDALINKLGRLKEYNLQNKALIEQSLEMIEFSMNVIQSDRVAPVNNYNKSASTQDIPISQMGMFDAKQ